MSMMMMTPDSLAVDFRAPPPSPVGPGRRSSYTNNDDVLTEFLHQSLKVPNLVLPDKVFPRQKIVTNPPVLDLERLEEIGSSKCALELVELFGEQLGCLEVINHGISDDFVKYVLDLGSGVFEISGEKKRLVARTHERQYGYEEEIHREGESHSSVKDEEDDEEFVWSSGDEGLKMEMEAIWPFGYSNFSENMEKLQTQIDEIGAKVLTFLQQNSSINFQTTTSLEQGVAGGKMCHIRKHVATEQCAEKSLRYDVIRMLIRGSEFPHALCVHICNGATEFQVYSKKGWVSFCPTQGSLVLTLGDKVQEWAGGRYKHVIGRPVFGSPNGNHISMSFLCLPQTNSIQDDRTMTVSITQQIIIVLICTLAYQLILHIHNFFYR